MLKNIIYRLWVQFGNWFGFNSRLYKEIHQHNQNLIVDMKPIFENLSFIKDGKYVA
jgi:hypothetical protein